MRHKIIRIIAALGIPLFPLGARFFPPQHNAGGSWEAGRAPREGPETPATVPAPEGFAEPGRPTDGALPPAEALAGLFIPPATATERRAPSRDGGPEAQTRPVPADGKFSYLGSIRDANDQEWLYIKETETGRIISVNASLASINGERWVVEIEGASYFLRRN
jgi:hypothetical protein